MNSAGKDKDKESACCPEFDPAPWDDKMFEWHKKKFIVRRIRTFFYMPLNFATIMKRLDRKIKDCGASIPDRLCLSDHTSKWNMDVYVAVDKEVEKERIVELSGTYYSKVYEGHFKDTGKWCQDFESIIRSKEMKIKKWFMWYTTCPKCARKYGKNYVVIISQVEKDQKEQAAGNASGASALH